MWQVMVLAEEGARPPTPCLCLWLSAPYCRSHAEYSKSKLARHLENSQKNVFFIFAGTDFVEYIGTFILIGSGQNVSLCVGHDE